MAHPQGTQGPPRVGAGPPLKEIANLYGNITSAPTPSTKDYTYKETISPALAQLAQVLAEHLKGTYKPNPWIFVLVAYCYGYSLPPWGSYYSI